MGATFRATRVSIMVIVDSERKLVFLEDIDENGGSRELEFQMW